MNFANCVMMLRIWSVLMCLIRSNRCWIWLNDKFLYVLLLFIVFFVSLFLGESSKKDNDDFWFPISLITPVLLLSESLTLQPYHLGFQETFVYRICNQFQLFCPSRPNNVVTSCVSLSLLCSFLFSRRSPC